MCVCPLCLYVCLEVYLNGYFSGIVNLHVCLCLSVSFSVCECLSQVLCVIVPLSVPSHGLQVFITTTTLRAQLPGCKNLAGFGVMGWSGPGAGGWLWERREAWEVAPAAHIPG